MSFAILLMVLAGLGLLVAQIWMIVVAFQNDEKVWGILFIVSFVIPIGLFVVIAFMAVKWSIARRPAILFLSSLGVFILSFLLVAQGASKAMAEAVESGELQAQVRRTAQPEESRPAPEPRPAEPAPEPRRAPPKPATPPPARPAAPSETRPADAATAGAAARPGESQPPPAPSTSPVTVEMVSLGEPTPTQMRNVRLRLGNEARSSVVEVKLDLDYLDARGARLGSWRTVHSGTDPLAGAQATNEFELQAFFVPQFTRSVRPRVDSVRFGDGTRWPPKE